jgi:hypothetical protein
MVRRAPKERRARDSCEAAPVDERPVVTRDALGLSDEEKAASRPPFFDIVMLGSPVHRKRCWLFG